MSRRGPVNGLLVAEPDQTGGTLLDGHPSRGGVVPRVTVLMAVYNGERYAAEAIESVLGQAFQDFEFLIINDGSTDGSREIILSYDDPRIRLVDNPANLGLTVSLNRGLELARGELVARQDADDISEPDRLARQVAFLDEHRDTALVGSWYREIDENGSDRGGRSLPCNSTEIRWRLLFHCPFIHSAVMFRRSAVVDMMGGYDAAFAYAQDWELWSRVARRFPVANIGEYLVRYRESPTSMTATYGSIIDDEIRRIRCSNMHTLHGGIDGGAEVPSDLVVSLMTELAFRPRNTAGISEVGPALRALFRLQAAFCRYYAIGPISGKAHRLGLRLHLGRSVLQLARRRMRAADPGSARSLFLQAIRLHPLQAFTRSAFRLGVRIYRRGQYAATT